MTTTPNDCFHLTVDIVREIHAEAIARFGSTKGVRQHALLESAVAAPQATFGGSLRTLTSWKSPRLLSSTSARITPFVDGNKRAALGACIVFLRLNGIEPAPDGSDWEVLTVAVAASETNREQTTNRLRQLAKSKNQKKTSRR